MLSFLFAMILLATSHTAPILADTPGANPNPPMKSAPVAPISEPGKRANPPKHPG